VRGQWVGTYTGSNSGRATVDIDEVGRQFRGYAYMYDSNVGLPSTRADINVSVPAGNVLHARLPLQPIDPVTGNATTWAALAASYPPGIQFPKYADAQASWNAASLTVSWMSDIGTNGSMVLPVTQAGHPSICNPEPTVTDWNGFKAFVDRLEPDRYIFRGQENSSWRLRTSFHRTQRANLERFLVEDIPQLRKHLSTRISHAFDLGKPDEHGAFVSLVQHHGYPTPLLDWTRSAFIGAFFAYRKIRNPAALNAESEKKVRIFVFDAQQWLQLPQVSKLAPAQPHVSLLDALAIENTRMIPQQALSTITNVDDIESYIQYVESIHSTRYLRVIDLPVRERKTVMNALRQMGITAGSMFPGLDGTCEALREQYFPLG
jgi:FRG domain